MKELVKKLFARRRKVEDAPETKLLVEALQRLAKSDDFQLFRGLIQCYYADCVRMIAACPGDMVDVIRGQMSAYDRVFTISGDAGIAELQEEEAQREEISRMMSRQIEDVREQIY